MKAHILPLLGLSLLVLGDLGGAWAMPQRGSRGSSGPSASPSRGWSSPSPSFQGSRGSSSPASRPSSSGSSGPRPSSIPSAGSRSSGGSIRPSAPPTLRPAPSSSSPGSPSRSLPGGSTGTPSYSPGYKGPPSDSRSPG